jgi:hypothetical protein
MQYKMQVRQKKTLCSTATIGKIASFYKYLYFIQANFSDAQRNLSFFFIFFIFFLYIFIFYTHMIFIWPHCTVVLFIIV